jgi:oligopeptide/dipeptide ABC transporter ATP-binding protein
MADTDPLFTQPLHPYTQALLSAIPIPDPELKRERVVLQGDVPSPAAPPSGCRFHTRCPAVMPICSQVDPPMLEVRPRHWVACHLYPQGIEAAAPSESTASMPAPLADTPLSGTAT